MKLPFLNYNLSNNPNMSKPKSRAARKLKMQGREATGRAVLLFTQASQYRVSDFSQGCRSYMALRDILHVVLVLRPTSFTNFGLRASYRYRQHYFIIYALLFSLYSLLARCAVLC
jgi:hypothetical protein